MTRAGEMDRRNRTRRFVDCEFERGGDRGGGGSKVRRSG